MTLCWSDKSKCFSGGVRFILVYTYNAIGNGDMFPNQRARYVDIISTMITVILDFHYKSWLPFCTTHPYSCVSTLPLYNCKVKELRLLLPVRGLALRNSPLINPLRSSDAQAGTKLIYHWFRRWLFALSAPSHYLNQCRKLSIGLLERNISEFLSTLLYIIKKNAFEHVICGIPAILVLVSMYLAGTGLEIICTYVTR